jgi:hypothetical protein
MDAVPFRRKRDPHETDGIVRARRKIERLFLHMDTAQIERRVVVIGRIFGNARDLNAPEGDGRSVLPTVAE